MRLWFLFLSISGLDIGDHYSAGDSTPYFLGSIVLAGVQDKYLILDGQQRLTTVSLLLAVLKQKLEQHHYHDAGELNKYLVSGKLGMKKMAKLQLQPEDNDVYLRLIGQQTNKQIEGLKHNPLVHAVRKISSIIDRYALPKVNAHTSVVDIYELMASRVIYNVEFVRIIAPSESEAFKLFETLNDRGLALNAADLIKNKLFSQCGTDLIKDAIDTWREIVDLVGEGEIVNFLRYYWIAFKGNIRKRGLYDAYRDELDRMKPMDAAIFAESIKTAAEAYQHITNPDPHSCPWGSDTGEALERIAIFRARSCRPVLLACAEYAREFMHDIAKLCETITVRYSMVSELNPNQLETDYGKLCQVIREDGPTSIDKINQSLMDLFTEIPSDKDFMDAFSKVELVNVTNAWRQILIRLNDFVATGETRIEGPQKVHVEHIFPRNPTAKAYKEANISTEEAPDYIGRIGNLTLLSGRKNRTISNGPFSTKVSAFALSEIAL
jgi:hypothetical protein